MHETGNTRTPGADPLAEIIRAAGRRSEPPREHYEQVLAAARDAWQQKVRMRRRGRWLALAASIAAVSVAVIVIQGMLTPDPAQAATIALLSGPVEYATGEPPVWRAARSGGVALEAGARLRTGIDGRTALRLAGGGSLRIDVATEVVLGASGLELVAGTLYFDSDGRSAAAPIEITTALGTVRDIGTQFEVRVASETLRVRIRSGQIAIVGASVADELVRGAGNEIELSADRQPVERTFAPDDPAWAWAEALAVAPGAQTQSILAWLTWIAHESGKRLEFDTRNAELRAEIEDFVGDPEGLTPMELLSLIAATSDFRYQLTDDGTILIQRSAEP